MNSRQIDEEMKLNLDLQPQKSSQRKQPAEPRKLSTFHQEMLKIMEQAQKNQTSQTRQSTNIPTTGVLSQPTTQPTSRFKRGALSQSAISRRHNTNLNTPSAIDISSNTNFLANYLNTETSSASNRIYLPVSDHHRKA